MKLTTELDAVNRILISAGEDPISSLSSPSAQSCKVLIEEVLHDLLIIGWSFNTDYSVILSRNTDNEILIPVNAISVNFDDNINSEKYSIIDNKVYDQHNRTFTFSKDLKATIVYLREFTEIPEPFRVYVTKSAKRRYAASFTAGEHIQSFIQEEAQALQSAKQSEVSSQRFNIFNNRHYLKYRQRGI